MIKDGYNGFLSDDLSLDSYARALRRFLNLNEEERTKIKRMSLRVLICIQ